MVTFFELELPAFTPVKLKVVGLSERATEPAVPVPLRATTVGEPGALLAILTLPLKLPVVVGAKSTLNVAVPPGAIVAGALNPLALNALPVTENCEIARAAAPVFVTVKLCDFD